MVDTIDGLLSAQVSATLAGLSITSLALVLSIVKDFADKATVRRREISYETEPKVKKLMNEGANKDIIDPANRAIDAGRSLALGFAAFLSLAFLQVGWLDTGANNSEILEVLNLSITDTRIEVALSGIGITGLTGATSYLMSSVFFKKLTTFA